MCLSNMTITRRMCRLLRGCNWRANSISRLIPRLAVFGVSAYLFSPSSFCFYKGYYYGWKVFFLLSRGLWKGERLKIRLREGEERFVGGANSISRLIPRLAVFGVSAYLFSPSSFCFYKGYYYGWKVLFLLSRGLWKEERLKIRLREGEERFVGEGVGGGGGGGW